MSSKTPHRQRGVARVKTPERAQVEMQLPSLDQWLDPEHRVRVVWQYVESPGLTELYEPIRATLHGAGRDAVDPRIPFALWLFATIEGESSGRRVDELTRRDIPCIWLCGGVSVNYHLVCDFRQRHGELLERVLTDSIAVLIHQGLIDLETVAQDGMRVRASAGGGSFRSDASLAAALEEAEAHVARVRRQAADEGDGGDRRRQAARERAAVERQTRIAAAREELKDVQARQDRRSGTPRDKPRASTTDPEARRMKMGDGGTRPAFNVQFASDGDAQMTVAADVTGQGSDAGLMKPMYDDVCERHEAKPEVYLVDGGFAKKDDVTHLERQGTKVHAPLYAEKKQLEEGGDPYAARTGDTPEMAAHRQRMGTAEAKETYRRRPAIAEFPNADCRNRGLYRFRVRGLVKVKAQTLWHALAFNFMRMRNPVCPLRKISYLEVVMAG